MKNLILQEYLDNRKKFLITLCLEEVDHEFLEGLRGRALGGADCYYADVLPSTQQSEWSSAGSSAVNHEKQVDDARTSKEQIAEILHSLADKLPTEGFQLDVCWYIPSASSVRIEENAALLGALKRLQAWHSAQVTLLQPTNEKSALSHWMSILEARYEVLPEDNVHEGHRSEVVWRGRLRLAEGKSNASLLLPGFQLSLMPSHSEITLRRPPGTKVDTSGVSVFDDIIDVVDIVNLDEVPRCLLLSDQMQLSVPAEECLPRSSLFLNWLTAERDEEKVAIVAQLPYRVFHSTLPSCASAGLGTAEWKEQLATDCSNFTVPETCPETTDNSEFILLYRGPSGECCVRQFVSVSELNGAVSARLAEMETLDMFKVDISKPVHNVMSDIPLMHHTTLQCILEVIADDQIQGLRELAEQRMNPQSSLAAEEVSELLSKIRRGCLKSLKLEGLTTDLQDDTVLPDLSAIKLCTDSDPAQALERLALINGEAVREKMRRAKSKDLQLAGMVVPLPVNDTITLHLNAAEFLKHFHPSGLPTGQDFSPIGIATRSRCSTPSKPKSRPPYTEEELRGLEFEDSLKRGLPGIHYCMGEDSLKSDARMARLIQRVVPMETATTCSHRDTVSVIKLRRARRSVSKSPVKKFTTTPRKSKSKQLGRAPENLKRPRRSATGTTPVKCAKKPKPSSAEERRVSPRQSSRLTTPLKAPRGPLPGTDLTFPKQSQRLLTPKKDPSGRPEVATPRRSTRLATPRKSEPGKNTPSKKTPQKRTGRTPRKAPRSQKKQTPSKRRAVSLSDAAGHRSRKMSRSEKHKKKLMEIVTACLVKKGVKKSHPCYSKCFNRLYELSKSYVKDLKTSKNLYEQMKQIVKSNADFAIAFELKSKSTSS